MKKNYFFAILISASIFASESFAGFRAPPVNDNTSTENTDNSPEFVAVFSSLLGKK